MAIFKRKYLTPEGELGLWKIEEEEDHFLLGMTLHQEEIDQLAQIKGHKRLEYLAVRQLLHEMSGRPKRSPCLKDEFGKPHLEDSLFHISMSHSHNVVAAIAAPRLVGVDIQKLVGKIDRISEKYMREEELESLNRDTRIEHLHVYWGAKECLYKAYGRKELEFKKHILIEPFNFDLNMGFGFGSVIKGDYNKKFVIHYEKIEDYILVYALEDIVDQRIA